MPRLVVQDELLRQQVEHFAVGRKADCAGPVNGGADVLARDLFHAAAHADAALRVHAADMRSADADDGGFYWRFRHSFRRQRGGVDSFSRRTEVSNQAPPHALGSLDAMPAIAQHAVIDFGHQHAAFGAACVQHGQQVVDTSIHWFTCPGFAAL